MANLTNNISQTLETILSHTNSLFHQWKHLEDELSLKSKQIDWKQKYLNKKSNEISLKEKKLNDRSKEIDETYKLIEKSFKTVKDRENHYDHKLKRLKEKNRHLRRNFWKKSRNFDVRVSENDPSYADLRINVIMNGRDLQMFLNSRFNDHEILRDEINLGLKHSLDPAKLVLDAILGFYSDELGDEVVVGGCELSVVRKSCILLLEVLMRLKPRISDRIRERSLRVAIEWKGKMNVDEGDCLEVVGFLQLVVSYGLICEFRRDELMGLFEGCVCYDRAIELCKCLDLVDDVHVIIQNLIRKHQQFEAIRLAHAFELFDNFPPVPILKSYLSSTFTNAEKVYENGDPPMEAQIKCVNQKLAALKSVMRCIKKYDLESKYPIQSLEHLILNLKGQKKKPAASKTPIKTQDKEPSIAQTLVSSSVSEADLTIPMDPGSAHIFSTTTVADLSGPSTDACGTSTSLIHSQTTMREVHTSEAGGSSLNDLVKKRPRLSSAVVAKDSGSPSPVNPFLTLYTAYGPVYYLRTSSRYNDCTSPLYSHYSW